MTSKDLFRAFLVIRLKNGVRDNMKASAPARRRRNLLWEIVPDTIIFRAALDPQRPEKL